MGKNMKNTVLKSLYFFALPLLFSPSVLASASDDDTTEDDTKEQYQGRVAPAGTLENIHNIPEFLPTEMSCYVFPEGECVVFVQDPKDPSKVIFLDLDYPGAREVADNTPPGGIFKHN